jgi:thiol-disulfide isomerase/thioredoxin
LKGKTTFLNFWASWCGYCREELPRLEKLEEKYRDRPEIQFLTLNIDDNPGMIEPFMAEKKLSLIVLPAYSYVSDTLKVSVFPQNWIVDAAGVVS